MKRKIKVSKWRSQVFLSSRYFDFGEILEEKSPFPKEFFNKFWVRLGEHEYNYVAEIKFEIFIPV